MHYIFRCVNYTTFKHYCVIEKIGFTLTFTFLKGFIQMENKVTKAIYSIITMVMLGLLLSACAKKIAFQTSAIVPAARGNVKVKKDNNSNYAIKVFIRNLAEVKRLSPPKTAYIVWMETSQQPVKNIGKIDSDNKRFSNKLKASFESVSPTKPTKIFITAEDDASTQYPSYQLILSTNNF
jgi:hypothetical protein